MFKNFSAGYYQKIKERLQERAHERYQGLPEKKKKKNENMDASDIEIFLTKKKEQEHDREQ